MVCDIMMTITQLFDILEHLSRNIYHVVVSPVLFIASKLCMQGHNYFEFLN